MFGLGLWEIVIIAVVALVVLGPDKLPDVARRLGQGLKEVRRASHELQDTLQQAVQQAEEQAGQGLSDRKVDWRRPAEALSALEGAVCLTPPEGIQPRDQPQGESPATPTADEQRKEHEV